MSIIFFSSNKDKIITSLKKSIETVLPGVEVDLYQSIKELLYKLRQSSINESVIAVLLTRSLDEIRIISSTDFFSKDIRILLILPDNSPETLSAGFSIHPRFIGYIDDDFNNIALVLRKMIMSANKRDASNWQEDI